MAWVVDQQRLGRRRNATATLAMAANYVDMMREKSSELLGQTQVEVAGHPVGDQIISDVARSVDALSRAHGLLLQAKEVASNANVMVEVPDTE